MVQNAGETATENGAQRRGTRYALRIGHKIANYGAWKETFDQDPLGRAAHGVRLYRVLRPMDDPSYVSIDLEFDAEHEARAFQTALTELWKGVAGSLIDRPEVSLVEIAEVRELGRIPR